MQALAGYADDSDTSPGPSRRKSDNEQIRTSRSPSRPTRPSSSEAPTPPSRSSLPATAMSSRPASPDRNGKRRRSSSFSADEVTEEEVRRATWPEGEDWGIPPAADPALADERLTAKVQQYLRLKQNGQHILTSLTQSSSFANPHIYTKLVEFVDIDERASAFPNGGWLTRHRLEDQIPTYGPKALLAQQNAMAEAAKRAQAGRQEIAFTGSKTERRGERDRDRDRRREGRDREGLHRAKADWEGSGRRERHRR